jgi:hypothetical protein
MGGEAMGGAGAAPGADMGMEDELASAGDEFAGTAPAAGGTAPAGRDRRESIEYSRRLGQMLTSKKK